MIDNHNNTLHNTNHYHYSYCYCYCYCCYTRADNDVMTWMLSCRVSGDMLVSLKKTLLLREPLPCDTAT